MSGRSAYVRREKVTAAQKHAHQQIVSTGGYIAAGPPSVAYSGPPPQRARGSFSSGERGPYVPHPYGFASEAPSRIEKSTFRNFLDRKSDAFRAKLAAPFQDKSQNHRTQGGSYAPQQASSGNPTYSTGAQPPNPYANLPRSASGYPTASAYDGPQWQDFKPSYQAPESQRRPPVNATQSYDYARQKATTFDFGDAMRSVKRFEGSGRVPQSWNRLQKDPELWDYTGDTVVYLGSETEGASRPAPSFRIHSSFLEETESPFFRTILREGKMEFGQEFELPHTPISMPREAMISPELGLPVHGPGRDSRNNSNSQWAASIQSRSGRYASSTGRNLNSRMEITPPNSDPDSNNYSHPISFEIYFPAPSDLSRSETLRYHLTTRNVFALLIHKSLVGTSLGQTLKDLHERMEMYMPEDFDTTSLLIDYVVVKGLDDVRNDPSSAAGLLIWSETPGVNWVEAWREAYVTCVALYPRIRAQTEYRAISAISRALMERANLELSVRIQHAEDRLIAFDFDDMWPTSSINDSPSREAFDRFSKFLVNFYNTAYWSWPPPGLVQNGQWLSRETAMRLQKDFGALYSYIVDRDVAWEDGDAHNPREKRLVKHGLERNSFRADTDDLPMTDILLGFDKRYRYPHIPHPFPLQPDSIPVNPSQKAKRPSKKEKSSDMRTFERRVAMAYSEATNLYILGSGYSSNELVEAFLQFEKSDKVMESNPLEARRGRWILLYGILQTLATVAIDTPGLRWTDDVPYFLGPKLKGTPPWRTRSEEGFDEASHENSYCWTVSKDWPGHGSTPTSHRSFEAQPALSVYRSSGPASDRSRSRAERLMPNTPDHIQKVNTVIGSRKFQSDYINEALRKSEVERENDEHNWARELERQRMRAADQTSSKGPSRATNRSRERLSPTFSRERPPRLPEAEDISADHRWRLEELEREQGEIAHGRATSRSQSPPVDSGHVMDQRQQSAGEEQTTEQDWKELRKRQARERLSKDLMKSGPQRQHHANNVAVNRMQSLGEEIEEMRLDESAHQNGLGSIGTYKTPAQRRKLHKSRSIEPASPQQNVRQQGTARPMDAIGSVDSVDAPAAYNLPPRTTNNSQVQMGESPLPRYGMRRDLSDHHNRQDSEEVSRERPHDPREQGGRDVSISPPITSTSGFASPTSAPNTSYTTLSSMPSNQTKHYYPSTSTQSAGSQSAPVPRPTSSRGQKSKQGPSSPGAWPVPGPQGALGMDGRHHISEMMNSGNQGVDAGRAY